MTVASYEWLRDGEFIQGGPATESEASELEINSAGPGALHAPIIVSGFGKSAPGHVLVRLYSNIDEGGAPAGTEERLDCSIPEPPDADMCKWQENVNGLTLTLSPETANPAALTVTSVYVLPLDLRPEGSDKIGVHATWVIAE
ncbi:hypothetical protein GCM10022262_42640 [Georgenia daeguensis]|uniref:Uncharacterized protein n=1 Tax=Georgenia daeguensis TaxID=908355 RepID=A0ABP6UNJ1_9MICO